MSKFKVGDRVRIVDCPIRSHIGAEGVIEYVNDADSKYTYRADFADIYFDDWFEEKDLELIEPETISETETVEKPKFKVGDTVEITVGDYAGYIGKLVEEDKTATNTRIWDIDVGVALLQYYKEDEFVLYSGEDKPIFIKAETKFKIGDKVKVMLPSNTEETEGIGKIVRIYNTETCLVAFKVFARPYHFSRLELVEEEPTIEPDATSSTYTDNIIALMNRQHEKGLKKYGETLEENTTLSTEQRIEHLQEELIDGLQYCEHLKAIQDNLTVNDYQRMAMRTANPDSDSLCEAIMGLSGEVGECADIVKKNKFQGHEMDKEHLIEELGDVCWYAALASEAVGVPLETIMLKNIEKLKKRYPEGFDKARSINRED